MKEQEIIFQFFISIVDFDWDHLENIDQKSMVEEIGNNISFEELVGAESKLR